MTTTGSTLVVAALACAAVVTRPTASHAQVPAADTTARIATVSVESGRLGARIPSGFIGYSLEVSVAGQGIGAFQGPAGGPEAGGPAAGEQPVYALGNPGAPNAGYFRFMKNLGPGLLRLGGNSQDNTCWDQATAPHPEACAAPLDSGQLALFAAAARASGWRLIVGLNLKQNAPAWTLREVTEGVARLLPAGEVFALEPGNEPDLFGRTPYRARSYTAAEHVNEFLDHVRALAADPVARRYAVVGPATCCGWRNPRDLAAFIDGVGRARLKWVTVHNYSETTCGGRMVTAARLLSPELMQRFDEEARPLVTVARARGVPIAMAETNSASCGGMPGVSNAFAAALWGLDYAFTLADEGFVHVDFHSSYRPGGGSSYNPVDTYARQDASGGWVYRNVAEPLYYALYLFGRHAAGARLLPVTIETSRNVRAWAVSRCATCAVQVFILNKDTAAAGPVRVRLGGGLGRGSLLLLEAPGLGSLAPDVRYGGRQFDSEGRLDGAPQTSAVAGSRGDYTVTLPNAAIALLTVERTRGRRVP